MAYTDKTVYKMRECLNEYTDIALSLRNEKEKNSELRRIAVKHGISVKKIRTKNYYEKLEKEINNIKRIPFRNRFLNEMTQCMSGYVKCKQYCKEMKEENKLLKKLLEKNGIEISDPYITFDNE